MGKRRWSKIIKKGTSRRYPEWICPNCRENFAQEEWKAHPSNVKGYYLCPNCRKETRFE